MLRDIVNYYEISPSLGTAGLPSSDQLADLKAAGYHLVIDLLPHSLSEGNPEEPSLVAGLGMDYLNIPVIWEHPTSENLAAYFKALQANQKRKVFAHCEMNFRVSAFTFLYRVLVQKIPVATAEQDMRQIWEPYGVWQAFIDQHLQQGPDISPGEKA